MKQLDLFGMWEEATVKANDIKPVKPVTSNDALATEVLVAVKPDEEPLVTEPEAPANDWLHVTVSAAGDEEKDELPADSLPQVASITEAAPDETVALRQPVSSIIFEDDKIAVKVKLKEKPLPAPVQQVASEEKPATEATATWKDPEKRPLLAVVKKRGRKSFKEIDAEVDFVEVPDDEVLFQKQYYAISQVAQWFHVNTSLVRYWENEFDILKPRKNRKGDRLFRPEDVKNLQVIYYLLRQRKFSIEGAKKYLRENKKNADTNLQLIQSLTKFRTFLLELKANLGA
ncbi:MerR family transcriptional regulator [Foetidibacter luteolus]|uniref:MerR family transcriptional regulator n=1 Tax=Foetidibacter luteolus TaxID=2608880 RepID=UPI001F1B33F6|nr:MerR family transcriptional regulator [Foetidibacter luteolus]